MRSGIQGMLGLGARLRHPTVTVAWAAASPSSNRSLSLVSGDPSSVLPRSTQASSSSSSSPSPNSGHRNAAAGASAPASSSSRSPSTRTRVQPEEISYSVTIELCSRKGEMQQAAGVLHEMIESPFKANVFAFNAVIAGFARNGSARTAAEWLERMVAERLVPNILSYNAVIDGYAKIGDLHGATEWFETMSRDSVSPDERSFNAVLRCCARVGDAKGALKWLKLIRKQSVPNQIAYNSAIRACANSRPKAADEAETLFREMAELTVLPSLTTVNALAEAVGSRRRDELCVDLNIDLERVRHLQERAEQRRQRKQSEAAARAGSQNAAVGSYAAVQRRSVPWRLPREPASGAI